MRRYRWLTALVLGVLLALAAALPAAAGTPLVQPLQLSDCGLPPHWAAPYACDLIHHNILPVNSTQVGFDTPVTQREFLLLLARALGRDQSDVSLDALLLELVPSAQKTDVLTREQAVVMLMNAVGGQQTAGADARVLGGYKDAAQLQSAARQAFALALLTGVVQGRSSGTLTPAASLTLGEALKLVDVAVPEQLAAGTDKLTILLYNDFHGHLQQDSKQRAHQDVGIERLTTALMGQLLKNPQSLLVDGGDSFQGTPISNLSGGMSVEEWRNQLGVKVATIGNHEFDWTVPTLKTLIANAKHPMLTANVFLAESGVRPDWAVPSTILDFAGYKIGVIGITTPVTKSIVTAANVAGLDFRDPAPVVDGQVRELRAKGADLIFVLAHSSASPGKNDPFQVQNEVAEWMKQVTEHVDAVTAGHSHEETAGYVVNANGEMVPVIQAGSYGRALGRIDLYVDRVTKQITKAVPVVWEPAQTLAPTPWAADLVAKWSEQIKPQTARFMGKVAAPLTRKVTPAGESAVGDFIADGMLTAAPGIQIALMNGGGIRADLEGDASGEVNWGHLYTIQPFGNTLVTVNMTGAQLKTVLEQAATSYVKQLTSQPGGHQPIQVAGIQYTWDFAKPDGQRIVSLTLPDGTPLGDQTSYKVVVNSFMATGGDDLNGLKALADQQTDLYVVDLDVAVAYFQQVAADKPLSYSLQNRVTVLNLPK